ncbi:MAG: filamentous hemagglutinin N-terminal domain-containing protein [Gallionella sp.]|nr:filamentous hemagglutinin N-terminal domain-containing protein [Gallionella sp.]
MKAHYGLKPVHLCVLLALYAEPAFANPFNPSVINGQASFATANNVLTVTNTPGTIINWQGFSIGANEITRFNQQSATSTVLNRVISNNPSSILGSLQSNGRVFLVNPNGIVFGAGATVDVAGLVASTLNLSNADFLAGRYHFTPVTGAGNISNAGNITAKSGGQIYLIAPNVTNTGIITAPNGEILLAAGHSVYLVDTTNPNLRVSITAPAGEVVNIGQLIASSGSIGLFGPVVRNSGTISANSATMQKGKVVLKAIQRVDAGGTISSQGGGSINIHADMQTGTANITGTLDASAPINGNGGTIDTSAARVLVGDTASVTTLSARGTSGTWLINTLNFTVAASAGNISGATLGRSLGSGNVAVNSLAGTGNGDVDINDTVSWNSAFGLTLNAYRHVNVNQTIASTGGGSVNLRADLTGNCVAGAVSCGTVNFSGSGHVTAATTNIYYNPTGSNASAGANGTGPSYAAETNYSPYVTGVLNRYMLVNDINQLQAINTNTTGSYALGRNIDATVTNTWNNGAGFMPLGLSGSFDGLNHTITNLVINRPSTSIVGLFGNLNGNVSNLGLINANITGHTWVGALAGISNGNITNVTVTGNVTGIEEVGGLVGNNQPGFTIERSSFSGNVTGVAGTGQYSGSSNYVGGLVGWQNGIVSNSYAQGSVSGAGSQVGGLVGFNQGAFSASIINSYAANSVSGVSVVGGLVGRNTGTVANSYWDVTRSGTTTGVGQGNAAGATGLTTAQMQQLSSYAGFDFVNIWGINQGAASPFHQNSAVAAQAAAEHAAAEQTAAKLAAAAQAADDQAAAEAEAAARAAAEAAARAAAEAAARAAAEAAARAAAEAAARAAAEAAARAAAQTPATRGAAVATTLVNNALSAQIINIPVYRSAAPVLRQTQGTTHSNADNSGDPEKQAAQDALISTATQSGNTSSETAALPICQ